MMTFKTFNPLSEFSFYESVFNGLFIKKDILLTKNSTVFTVNFEHNFVCLYC